MICVTRKENVLYFLIVLYISSVTEMLWKSLTRSLSTLVVRLIITGQTRDGNSSDSLNMDQRHGRSFMISRIIIPCILPSIIFHKALTMNQHSTGWWYIPSRRVTTSFLLYSNYTPYIWRRLTSLSLNYPRQFPKLMSLIRRMVKPCEDRLWYHSLWRACTKCL